MAVAQPSTSDSSPASSYCSYELLTGAGFTVERRGVAAVSGVAGKSQALLAVTTSARYKKLEPELRKIVDSFRVYDKVRSVETGALLDDD